MYNNPVSVLAAAPEYREWLHGTLSATPPRRPGALTHKKRPVDYSVGPFFSFITSGLSAAVTRIGGHNGGPFLLMQLGELRGRENAAALLVVLGVELG